MAQTDFASQQDVVNFAWAKETWKAVRETSFIMQRMGATAQSAIQKITELTALPSGNKAVINLLHDLEEDGVVGDTTLKGNEESAKLSQIEILIDQMRHAVANKGRMSDQKGVLKVRNEARGLLGYALGDRIDQLAFLTMAGVGYQFRTNGATRTKDAWSGLEFAKDVQPPSANRHFRWNIGSGDLEPGDTSTLTAADTVTFNLLLKLATEAHDRFIRPLRLDNGVSYYDVFLNPRAMLDLKLDPKFHEALKLALPRAPNNPIFKGQEVYFVDNLAIHSYRHSFTTRGAAAGSKWGAAGNIDGNRITLMGAQALAYAELGSPMWDEELDDYKAKWGVALAQILGFLKPQFPDYRIDGNPKEDFGMLNVDVAITT